MKHGEEENFRRLLENLWKVQSTSISSSFSVLTALNSCAGTIRVFIWAASAVQTSKSYNLEKSYLEIVKMQGVEGRFGDYVM